MFFERKIYDGMVAEQSGLLWIFHGIVKSIGDNFPLLLFWQGQLKSTLYKRFKIDNSFFIHIRIDIIQQIADALEKVCN